ncbi:MAG: ABC transporter permease [Clostridia bacterium]|nr:ABC transporter permease [Clostridia bacterium]
MIKLLRANLLRISKSVTFWIFVALYTLYPIIIALIEIQTYEPITSDKMLSLNYGVEFFPMQGVIIALLCSILFNADFSNGTLRNKVIIGLSRSKIYLTNLLTMIIISLGLSVIYIIIFFALGMPLLGKFTSSASTIIWMIVDGSLVLMAYSAIMTLIVMTCKNPIASLIISALVITLGALLSYYMDYIVSIPEVITTLSENQFGETIWVQIPNENAPSQAVKAFCRFVTDLLPSGQSFQLSSPGYTHGWTMDMYSRGGLHYWQMALYSLGIIGATSGIGILIFKKNNIK